MRVGEGSTIKIFSRDPLKQIHTTTQHPSCIISYRHDRNTTETQHKHNTNTNATQTQHKHNTNTTQTRTQYKHKHKHNTNNATQTQHKNDTIKNSLCTNRTSPRAPMRSSTGLINLTESDISDFGKGFAEY